jgi:hypothetical protein
MSFLFNIKNLRMALLFGFVVASYLLTVLPVHAATFSKPPSNFGLIGHWSFDEGVSTIVRDFSGNGFNGVMTNMDAATDWVAGKRGKALDFDGVDDHVALPSTPLFARVSNGTAITISAWFKGSDIESLVRLQDSGSDFIVFGWTSSGTFAPRVLVSTDGNTTGVDIGGGVLDGKWHHIAFTWEKNTTNGFRVYVDGAITNQKNAANVNLPDLSGSTGVYFGSYQGTSEFTAGTIDDVRIYNRALSQSDIKALATVGQAIRTGVSERGLVAHWSLDEGTSTIAHDFSGNGHNGNLTNMDATTDWVTGKKGKALDFDGVDDRVLFPSLTNAFGDFTACVWFNALPTNDGHERLIDKNFQNGFWLGRNGTAANSWGGGVRESLAPYGIFVTLPDGQWNHICSIRSGTTHFIIGNGGAVSTSNTVSSSALSADTTALGTEYVSGVSFFDGQIDDVRIYDRALSFAEVKSLYQQNKTLINAPQKDQLTNGLVGYWSFNAPDIHWPTSVAYDRSGMGNNGSIVNMSNSSSPVAGASGQALNFDSINDHILVPNSTSLNITSSITISAWIKPNSFGQNNFGRIVHKDGVNGYIFSLNNNSITNGLLFYSGGVNASTSNVITLNRWQHVASVFNGSTVTLYVNGIAVSTQAQPALTASTASLGIGIRPADSLRGFDGIIDEVRIYNRALSDSEMKQLYGMGRK